MLTKIRQFAEVKGGAGFPHEDQGALNHPIPFYKVAALGEASPDGYLQRAANTITEETATALGARVFSPGTVTFAKVGEALKLNRFGLLKEPACLDNNMMGLVLDAQKAHPRFVRYALGTRDMAELVNPGAVPSINGSQVGNVLVWLPSLATQAAIANYLDAKTAAIDALIAKKGLLIEELKKYTQAVVTETVLRGLNPTAQLALSRAPGMGLIPSHWQVAKTSKVLRYVKGVAVPKEDLATEGDPAHRFLRTGDFWNINGHEKDQAFATKTDGLVWKNEGELVVCFDGFNSVAGKGTVGMARFDGAGYIDSHLEKVDVLSSGALKRYFEYVHLSAYLENEIVKTARGAIAFSAGYGKSEILVPVPPLEEQRAIAEYLDAQLSTVRPLVENSLQTISEMKRLRAALISEAVTGKLKLLV